MQQQELLPENVTSSQTSLSIPEGINHDCWSNIGLKLVRSGNMLNWLIGDWAAYGEKHYGKVKDFCDVNGLDYNYVRKCSWVSQSISPGRRLESVDWSKHHEIAALPEKKQTEWLEKVQSENMSAKAIRREIRLSMATERTTDVMEGLKWPSKWAQDLVSWLNRVPDENWTTSRIWAWMQILEPLVIFHRKLVDKFRQSDGGNK